MTTLQLKINNRFFNIACDEGQEDDLKKIAAKLNLRLEHTYKILRNATPDLALVVTALMMQDELSNNSKSQTDYINLNSDNESGICQAFDAATAHVRRLALSLDKC